MKRNLNFRLIFLLLLLAVLAIREVAVELRPSFLRPGLHMLAYVGNTGDGTVTAIDLIALSRAATIATGPSPSGLRAHPTHPEIWGVSTDGGYAWVIDARSGRLAAKIQVGALPYAIDFSPDGKRAYVAASGANAVVAIDTASRQVTARGHAGRRPWIARAHAGWQTARRFEPRRRHGVAARRDNAGDGGNDRNRSFPGADRNSTGQFARVRHVRRGGSNFGDRSHTESVTRKSGHGRNAERPGAQARRW